MTYWIAALLLIFVVAVVLAVLSGSPTEWARREVRLINLDTFASDSPNVATMNDPRCQQTFLRLRAARAAMKRRGTKLLIEDRAPFRKIVTVADTRPEPASKVVPMRRPRR